MPMPKWFNKLNRKFYQLTGQWCDKHNHSFQDPVFGCAECFEEKKNEYVERTRQRWAEEEKSKTLERLTLIENTLIAVRELADRANSLEHFREMLKDSEAFKHRS